MKNVKVYQILLGFVILVLFFYSLSFIEVGSLNNKNNIINKGENSDGLAIQIPAGKIMVKNFTKEAVKQGEDTLLLRQNENFSILYFKTDQSFLIVLNSEPLKQNGALAEQELLKFLNIYEIEACTLKVSLTVPAEVNNKIAGKNYGLSFCLSKQSLLNFGMSE